MLGTLRDNFAGTVSKWSDRKAIISGDRTTTYGDLGRSPESRLHASELEEIVDRVRGAQQPAEGHFLHRGAEYAPSLI